MNKEVNFEIAILLQENGFDEVSRFYRKDNVSLSDCYQTNDFLKPGYYPAPTIAEVVMWLYEKHGIWISVDTDINGKFRQILRKHNSNDRAWEVKNTFSISEYYSSPAESYEAGIKHSLENLL